MEEPENGLKGIDYARAIRILLHANPETGIDLDGVNQVFAELGDEGRAGQCLIALADLTYEFRPDLRGPDGIGLLRRSLAAYTQMIESRGN